jgi:hypothetical protein
MCSLLLDVDTPLPSLLLPSRHCVCNHAQVNHREEWLACLRSAFESLDSDGDGRLRSSEILDLLRDKLPEADVRQLPRNVFLQLIPAVPISFLLRHMCHILLSHFVSMSRRQGTATTHLCMYHAGTACTSTTSTCAGQRRD